MCSKDSDSQSSTTKSGINTQNIIIKDEAEQLKRTGKTVQDEIAAIKTDITTESAQSQSGKLENRFNKDDVQKELDFQREVTEKFGPNVVEAGSLLANKFGEEAKAKRHEAAIALEEAEKAKAENNNETNRTLVKQARDNFETASREAKEWETGGSQRLVIDSALNVISTALAGRPAAEVVASGLSPAVNNQIKKATTDAKGNVNTALNLTAHALWGAVEAYAGNRNVAAGAAGAAGGEAAAHFLASTLYDKSPEKLSEEEKRTVSSLSQVAAGIAGGSLSDSSDGAIIAAKTAKDSVENNALTQGDIHGAYQRLLNGEDIEVVLRDLEHLSQKERDKLLADCDAACRQVVPSLLMAANDFSEEQAIAIGSILSKIPADQRSRVDMLVQSENSKTFEAIENSKSDVEKHIALAVKVMRFFQAENAVSGGKPNKLKATSVHSENKDYSKDVANLGVKNAKFNSELNNKVTQNERYVVAPKLIVDNQKYNYLFGNVKNDSHNTSRALQNKQQLSSIGIYDDRNGREIINKSLNEALSIRNSVKDTYSKNIDGKYQRFEAREGIITGPGGIRKFESHFEIMNDGSRRLTTIIFKGGN